MNQINIFSIFIFLSLRRYYNNPFSTELHIMKEAETMDSFHIIFQLDTKLNIYFIYKYRQEETFINYY
jgi:hypothetical protein